MNWKLSPCWLAFTVSEGAMQTTGGKQSPTVLLGYGPYVQKHQHGRQDVPDCAIVAQLSWVRPTVFQWDLGSTSIRGSSSLVY